MKNFKEYYPLVEFLCQELGANDMDATKTINQAFDGYCYKGLNFNQVFYYNEAI